MGFISRLIGTDKLEESISKLTDQLEKSNKEVDELRNKTAELESMLKDTKKEAKTGSDLFHGFIKEVMGHFGKAAGIIIAAFGTHIARAMGLL